MGIRKETKMKKLKLAFAIAIIIILSVLVAYDERHDTIPCKVVSSDSKTVCLLHPNGEYYTFYGSVGDAETVNAIFDNKGTENPYDDEVIRIK
jgi:hypothetical protein